MRRAHLLPLVLLVACDSSDPVRTDSGTLPSDGGSRPDAGASRDAGGRDAQPVADAGSTSITEFLASIEGLVAARVETPKGYEGYTKYELALEQPRDHENPADGVFTQHAYLLVLDDSPATAPFVIETHGYSLYDIGRPHEPHALGPRARHHDPPSVDHRAVSGRGRRKSLKANRLSNRCSN